MLIVSIVLAQALVNPAAAKAQPALKTLIERAAREGRPSTLGPMGVTQLGLPADAEQKLLYIEAEKATDGVSHNFVVAVESGTPKCIVFATHDRHPTFFEGHIFRADLEGRLIAAVLAQGKYDAAGKPVPGSGTFTNIDISKPEIRKHFQHELDFWLKGKYRKASKNKQSATQ